MRKNIYLISNIFQINIRNTRNLTKNLVSAVIRQAIIVPFETLPCWLKTIFTRLMPYDIKHYVNIRIATQVLVLGCL